MQEQDIEYLRCPVCFTLRRFDDSALDAYCAGAGCVPHRPLWFDDDGDIQIRTEDGLVLDGHRQEGGWAFYDPASDFGTFLEEDGAEHPYGPRR